MSTNIRLIVRGMIFVGWLVVGGAGCAGRERGAPPWIESGAASGGLTVIGASGAAEAAYYSGQFGELQVQETAPVATFDANSLKLERPGGVDAPAWTMVWIWSEVPFAQLPTGKPVRVESVRCWSSGEENDLGTATLRPGATALRVEFQTGSTPYSHALGWLEIPK